MMASNDDTMDADDEGFQKSSTSSPAHKKLCVRETNFVKLTNLPYNFLDSQITNFVKKLFKKEEAGEYKIMSTHKSKATGSYAIVQVASQSIVSKLTKLPAPVFLKHSISIIPYIPVEPVHQNLEEELCNAFESQMPTTPRTITPHQHAPQNSNKAVIITPKFSLRGDNNLNNLSNSTPKSRKSLVNKFQEIINKDIENQVTVSNIPKTFTEDHFIKNVTLKLKDALQNFEGFMFSDYDEDNGTAVLKFSEPKTADGVSQLKNIMYDGEILKFALHPDVIEGRLNKASRVLVSNIRESVFTRIKTSRVLVSNIPRSFTEDHFVKNVTSKFKDALPNFNDFMFSDYNEDNGTAVLNFPEPKTADGVSQLKNIMYDGEILKFALHPDVIEGRLNTTSRVLVSNIPKSFTEDHFIKNVTLNLKGALQNFDDGFTLHDYSEETGTAILDFSEPNIADGVSQLKNIRYDGQILNFAVYSDADLWAENTLLVSPNPETSRVLVSNIPKSFTEDHFIKNVTLNLKGALQNFDDGFTLHDYSEETGTAILDFSEPNIADGVSQLKNIRYDGQILQFELYFTVLEERPRTSKILVSNLPESFTKSHFLKNASKTFETELLLFVDFQIESYDVKAAEATLDFGDPGVAEDVAKLLDFKYDGNILKFSLYYASLSHSSFRNEEKVAKSPTAILCSGLPALISLDHFLKVFIKNLKDFFILATNGKWEMVEYRKESNSLILDFFDDSVARDVCQVDPFKYDEANINVQLFTVQTSSLASLKDGSNKSLVMSSPSPQLDDGSSSDSDCEAKIPKIPVGVNTRHDWPKLETLILLELCIKNKEYLNSGVTQKKGTGFKKVLSGLYKQNLYYVDRNVRKKLKDMLQLFEHEGEDWFYWPFLAEMKELKPLGSSNIKEAISIARSKRVPPMSMGSKKVAAARVPLHVQNKHLHGVFVLDEKIAEELQDEFDYPLTLLLLKLYKDRLPRFSDNKTRSSALYNEIAEEFKKNGYTKISADKCSKRMGYLSNEYKRRYDMRKLSGSGNEAQDWNYFGLMGQLLEKSAVIEPQRLYAFGSTCSNTVRSAGGTTSPRESGKAPKRAGRKRPSPSSSNKPAKPKASSSLSLPEYRAFKIDMARRMAESAEKLVAEAQNLSDSDSDP